MTGEASTDTNSSTPGRYSSISYRICGSIFAKSRMSTCGKEGSIISRTAGVRLDFDVDLTGVLRGGQPLSIDTPNFVFAPSDSLLVLG
jgi:hypothetical protein